jgi:hypothetical protein
MAALGFAELRVTLISCRLRHALTPRSPNFVYYAGCCSHRCCRSPGSENAGRHQILPRSRGPACLLRNVRRRETGTGFGGRCLSNFDVMVPASPLCDCLSQPPRILVRPDTLLGRRTVRRLRERSPSVPG